MRTCVLPALMLLALGACPSDTEADPTPPNDAGVDAAIDSGADVAVDAGVDAAVDAGLADAGVDAGPVDAGLPDAGVDAGPMDAGLPDAGVDAGPVDAGLPDAGVDAGPVDAGLPDVGIDAGVDAGLPEPTPLTLTAVPKGFNGFQLPAGVGTTPTLALLASAADFQTFFGVAAPAEIDFATEHALFYSAGSYPLGAGNSAVVTEALDTTADVAVTTVRTSPEADCASLSVPAAVWTLYRVTQPPSGATTLTETHTEETVSCAAADAGTEGAECSSTAVCGVDLICAGLSFGGDWGLCNPTSMWGTFNASTPVAIPDAGSVTLPLVVSTLATVEVDVILYVEITHPSPSQLSLTMLNPGSTQSVVVWDQVATTEANLTLHTVVLGFSGDETVNGEWALVVEDHVAGDTGTVEVLWAEMTSRWD